MKKEFIKTNKNKELGKAGELFVLNHLLSKNFKLLAKNFLVAGGELDLVVRKDNLIVFVEVKTRKRMGIFLNTNLVRGSKQRALSAAAKLFLCQQKISHDQFLFRFDIALVSKNPDGEISLEYIENAFTLK